LTGNVLANSHWLDLVVQDTWIFIIRDYRKFFNGCSCWLDSLLVVLLFS
jgi:hypothetical protein